MTEALENSGFVVSSTNILEVTKKLLENLDNLKDIMNNESIIAEIRELLKNPSISNWYRINTILVSTKIANLQDPYWNDMFNFIEQPDGRLNIQIEEGEMDLWEPNSLTHLLMLDEKQT